MSLWVAAIAIVLASGDTTEAPDAFLQMAATDSLSGAPVRCFAQVDDEQYLVALPTEASRPWKLPAGDHELSVSEALHAPARCSVRLVENCTTRVNLRLVPIACAPAAIAAIRGRVTDRITGEPVTGAAVFLDGAASDRRDVAFGRTDTGGFYVIQVPAGDAKVQCYALGYRRDSATVNARRNRIAKLNFSLVTGSQSSDSCLHLLRGVKMVHFLGSQYDHDSTVTRHNDSLRVVAWNAYRHGRARIAFRKLAWSVEGDPIIRYLLLDHGRATLIYNSLGDGWGNRQVTARPLTNVRLLYRKWVEADQRWIETEYPAKGHSEAHLALVISGPNTEDDFF